MTYHKVPKYSQHLHIETKEWRDKSCGITSLGMLLAYHETPILLSQLLAEGLLQNAYLPKIGWKHKGLVDLAREFERKGENFDWAQLDDQAAFENVKKHLLKYPVLASIHHKFDKGNGGHLIVLTGIDENNIYYNDPDATSEEAVVGTVKIDTFINGWKKRIIVIYPQTLESNRDSIV